MIDLSGLFLWLDVALLPYLWLAAGAVACSDDLASSSFLLLGACDASKAHFVLNKSSMLCIVS